MKNTKSENQDSLFKLADNLAAETKKLVRQTKTEEDLRIGFEKLLEPILKELGIKPNPKYEKSIYNSGRSDALHGQVVIEYELPHAFKSQKSINHAYEQLVGYIQKLSTSEKETLFLFESKFVGVGFDGDKIFFVRYKGDKSKAKIELHTKDFILIGPYDFDENSARTLLTHLRALARLPLTAENLADKFGPKSELAPKAVSAFANSLEYWGDQTRVRTFFNEWKRLFGIVYGEQFSGYQEKEVEALATLYKVGKETDFQELLFSVHTYFAFLMKLIAAELLTLRETALSSSLASELAHISEDKLKRQLEDIEDGGIYARKGITNFLEGDFFRWYLDAWSPRLKEAIQEITRALSEFEPATSTLDPTSTRDLLKKLYQYLVPQEVRHRLGEYYTPDWLAELLLNEVGYDGHNFKRVLDPACGSGTFLVLAIQRAKEWGIKNRRPALEIAKNIKANIGGFDLNPLAVIAARTNYLFALGDLANELSDLEVPIYLADSVLWPEQVGVQGKLNFYGEHIKVKTSAKEFHVPSIWVKDKGFLMKDAAQFVEKFAKSGFEPEIAMKHFKEKGLVFPPHEKTVENFYKEILDLEKQNQNGIWARFLKNAFAPMVAGQFDFVVGNPPWIRWDYLAQEYREATRHLWKDYGLFSLKGYAQMLGGAKPDFSMLFVYASSDYYLKDGAKLGFLITQEVFKSKGAGEGFRRFQLGDKKHLKVVKSHDLVTVQPFEGAANKTAAIILKKGEKTEYPVPYIIWNKKKGVGKIATDKLLDEALSLLSRKKLIAKPIKTNVGAWQTIEAGEDNLLSIEGQNYYRARAGAWADPYGIFWLEIKQVLSDGNLLVTNLVERGKTKIQKVEDKIESDLVYPAISGPDIQRWGIEQSLFVLLVNDRNNPMRGYPELVMKNKWPLTFSYLTRFRNELLQRTSYKKFHAKLEAPFYSQYNIGDYTFSRYKVVWKRMTTDIVAAVISEIKTMFNYKQVISLDTTVIFPVDNESEAHYLCAIINSKPVRDFIKSFSSAGRGFGTPSVMEHIGIPKFDPKKKLHQKLVEISKKCHQLKSDLLAEGSAKVEGKEKQIEKLEKENDELVRILFGIKK
ncbi:MAG: N-6 DNA methylase [Candidatus Edwardsbacteria bacterium]